MSWVSKLTAEKVARTAHMIAHRKAMNMARVLYGQLRGQDVVYIRSNEWTLSAASPAREAWDEYFHTMENLGFDARGYGGYDRFIRELGQG